MTRIRCTLALLLAILLTPNAFGQFLPPPVVGVAIIVQNGIGFQYSSRHLNIGGFFGAGNPYSAIVPVVPTPFGLRQVGPAFFPYPYGYPGYGSVTRQTTIQIINPPVVVVRRPRAPEYDLSGIDLDVESSAKIWGPKADAKKGELVKNAPKDQRQVEVAKVAPPPEKKDVAALKPKIERLPEGRRLSGLGVAAFQNGEFGLAMLRFRQAVDVEPPEPRALFLNAQAYIAAGKYQEAARTVQRGLQILPDFPKSGFRPKIELYANQEAPWQDHRRRLEHALTLAPKNADYLFLLGYLAWFDDQRETAIDYFTRARVLADDPRWSDAFLKAAKGK